MKLLEKDMLSASINQLTLDLGLEGISNPTLKETVGKLMREGLVKELSPRRYVSAPALDASGRTFKVTIEKIHPGSDVVMIDEYRWKVRLIPEDYNGPRSLIKKNSRFGAVAKLYKVDYTL